MHQGQAVTAEVLVIALATKASETITRAIQVKAQVEVGLFMVLFAGSGILVLAPMAPIANAGIAARLALKQVSWVSSTGLLTMKARVPGRHSLHSLHNLHSVPSEDPFLSPLSWDSETYLKAHRLVRNSGKYNFAGCMIPVPTAIRYDRIRESLGDEATPKDLRVLELLKYGMPINCQVSYGIHKPQKNHFSALSFKKEVSDFFSKSVESKAMLGPFKSSPIPDLCFSPLMTVPKDTSKRRVIVDFSFPPGKAINDGIPKSTYLEFEAEFSLPSVKSMVDRINSLGKGCLLFKRDLLGAFRQFAIDPGDYVFTGLSWGKEIFIDTRLAMGLRSSAFCCQSVTEMVARVVGKEASVFVYLDDFGGADTVDKAQESFTHLGRLLSYFGLQEAPDKAVAPTTKMEWLGISFNTMEWTMALKPGKLKELLDWLPMLLRQKRVKKSLLQKILGNLVWASAVVRSGTVFFNRLLALLRKLKKPGHSIYFSKEAKRDVAWWLATLGEFRGVTPIPPSVWTPLVSFYTDASLDGFGMVWGSRAMAGLFPLELEELDITKKEMVTVMVAVKHWFHDLSNLKVKIYVDNQAVVFLLNYGITRSPYLAACLREIFYVLAMFNIELRAEYIPSKENCLADLCSRAFSSNLHFNQFNKLLNDKVLILEDCHYEKFQFELDL